LNSQSNILFVSHDANRAGAQLFLLNLMLFLKERGYNLSILILTEYGSLLQDFEKEFNVYYYHKSTIGKKSSFLSKFIKREVKNDVFQEIKNKNKVELVYLNTIASAWAINIIKEYFKVPVISHIHELGHSLELYANETDRTSLIEKSSKIIACSDAVGKNLFENFGATKNKLVTIHSFIKNEDVKNKLIDINTDKIKEQFNIPKDKFLVGACGNAEWRKGTDVFLSVANSCIKKDNNIVFIWIGMKNDGKYSYQIKFDIELMGIKENVILIEQTPYSIELIKSLDVFFVSSREDPFPLVMLEAAICKKAIIGFDNTGGCSEFLDNGIGKIIPYLDVEAASNIIFELKNNPPILEELGNNAHNSVISIYDFKDSCSRIENIIVQELNL
jgi:glycosyltransferase involved in cell wall biosynthesis